MRNRWLPLMAAGGAVVALGACGVTGNFRFDPGFAPLGSPGLREANRQLALSLGPLPLSLARAFLADDPELSGILRSLKGVRVYVYEVNGDAERVRASIEATRRELVERGWHRVFASREDGRLADALVRMEGPHRMQGLVVMVQDDEEVVLVNLIGSIEPETFALAMDELGIDLPATTVSLERDRPVWQ